ncbi:TonB-dependent receptor [Allopontixanthobacter sp.]|uniref:TonB-dependent receptor n=1 Tax=Allopontixanthobacter sp. TaxID=2906452 RepID=UPI002AC94E72|nr:TonB-dependent receptor [Allopontixanthobacter sp.]
MHRLLARGRRAVTYGSHELTHRTLKNLALAGALALPAALHAQPAPDLPPDPVIVVTGRGLEQTPATPAYDVQTIDRDRITASASGRIEDVLSDVAGFQQFRRSDSRSSNPSAQGVTLRALGGNATSRALVLLDGVPMADPFFGYIPFSAIAPERLSSIRITRGGGSGAFGAGAVAGTIELESADAATLGLASGSLAANHRGATEASATLAPRLGRGFAVVWGRWFRGPGFQTTPAEQRVPASARSAYDSWSAGIRMAAPVTEEIELQARALLFDDRRTLRFGGADSTSSGQDASIRLVGRGSWAFDALAYVQARDFSNIVISSTRFVPVLDQRRTPSTGLGGKLEVRPPVGGGHVLRLGADYRKATGELQEEALSAFTGSITARRRAGGTNSDLGLFVEDDWTLGRLVLTAGARADRWTVAEGFFLERDGNGAVVEESRFADRSGWDLSFRGGALFRAGAGLDLRAAVYSGVRLPTLNELYRPFVVFPVVTLANEALENEALRGFEVGVDFEPAPDFRLSLTAFDNRVKNAIANVTIGTNLRQRRNVDAVRARGLELAAQAKLGEFSLNGSLAWTDAEVEGSGLSADLDGMRPSQTPALSASTTIAYEPASGWRLAATLRHVGRQFEDDRQSDVLPAATTIDAFVQIPLARRVALILRGENLTDTNIITRNQGGSIDLGVPLTVWAGIRFGQW